MEFSNSHKLAKVVSSWARPAISQIASEKVCALPMMKSIQSRLIESGIVTQSYRINTDIEPMIVPVVDALIQPMLEGYFSKIPDESIPSVANSIINNLTEKGEFVILDGVVSFELNDLMELKNLISKNLPIKEVESYEIIKD